MLLTQIILVNHVCLSNMISDLGLRELYSAVNDGQDQLKTSTIVTICTQNVQYERSELLKIKHLMVVFIKDIA